MCQLFVQHNIFPFWPSLLEGRFSECSRHTRVILNRVRTQTLDVHQYLWCENICTWQFSSNRFYTILLALKSFPQILCKKNVPLYYLINKELTLHLSNYALILTRLTKTYKYLIIGKIVHICHGGVSYHPTYHIQDGWLYYTDKWKIQHFISSWDIELTIWRSFTFLNVICYCFFFFNS